jgi:hypothetical protein
MVTYLTDFGTLSALQSGFCPGHCTVTALLNITDDIYGMLDQEYFDALVLLDFSKALDSIDHLLLCRKLESRNGFSSSAVSFLSSYLLLRFQCVSSGSLILICCRLISASHRDPFLVRSYFHFSSMISVGLSSRRITICMPMIVTFPIAFIDRI